jgi:hypothetical protein
VNHTRKVVTSARKRIKDTRKKINIKFTKFLMKSNILFDLISSRRIQRHPKLLKLVRNKKIILYPVLAERVPPYTKKKFRVLFIKNFINFFSCAINTFSCAVLNSESKSPIGLFSLWRECLL